MAKALILSFHSAEIWRRAGMQMSDQRLCWYLLLLCSNAILHSFSPSANPSLLSFLSLSSLSPSFLSFLPVSHGSFINLKQRTYVLRDIDMVHLFSHFLKTCIDFYITVLFQNILATTQKNQALTKWNIL